MMMGRHARHYAAIHPGSPHPSTISIVDKGTQTNDGLPFRHREVVPGIGKPLNYGSRPKNKKRRESFYWSPSISPVGRKENKV